MEGLTYGAIIALILVAIARFIGVRGARGGRAIAFSVLLLGVYFLVDFMLRAAGVDPFWSVAIALVVLAAVSYGFDRLRPASFGSGRPT